MKEMLSKETFCKALQLIREQQQVDRDFGEALNMVGEGHFVFRVMKKDLNNLLLALSVTSILLLQDRKIIHNALLYKV